MVLLVSADFIDSDYCWQEMNEALQRHERGEARVIPVIIRQCQWHKTPLAKLQAVPKDGKPVASWADRDTAFDDVASAIARIIEDLQEQRRAEEQWLKRIIKKPLPQPTLISQPFTRSLYWSEIPSATEYVLARSEEDLVDYTEVYRGKRTMWFDEGAAGIQYVFMKAVIKVLATMSVSRPLPALEAWIATGVMPVKI